MTLSLKSLGNQNYYARLQYDTYQFLVSTSLEPLYVAYTHTDPYFTPPASDSQAPDAPAFQPAPPVNVAAQIADMQSRENANLKSLLTASTLNDGQI